MGSEPKHPRIDEVSESTSAETVTSKELENVDDICKGTFHSWNYKTVTVTGWIRNIKERGWIVSGKSGKKFAVLSIQDGQHKVLTIHCTCSLVW